MTAKDFLIGKTLTSIEIVENLILNLVIEQAVYGMELDTTSINAGTLLTRTEDFTIDGDILTSGDLSLDLSTTDMLGLEK